MTSRHTAQVLKALASYAQFHARARMELSSATRAERELRDRWQRNTRHLVDAAYDDDHEAEDGVDEDEVVNEALDYLRSGDAAGLEHLRAAAEELAEIREGFTGPLAALARDHLRAEQTLEAPHRQLSGALHRWMSALQAPNPDRPEPAEMGTILATWRSATGLTAREAGQVLGISPSAVWRYEEGDRTPTRRTIETLVAAMNSSNGLTPHASEWRDALRAIADMSPMPEEELQRSLDRPDDRSARQRIVDGLKRLDERELGALAELVDDPDALPDLLSWAAQDPLRSVRDAVGGAIRREGAA